MPPLKDKLENALNEGRILMLGVQVLIGFDYNAVFQQKFAELPQTMQDAKLVSLALLIISLAGLLSPIPYHWIAGRGQNHRQLHEYAQKVIEWALLPFALAMSLDVAVASTHVISSAQSHILAASVLLLAVSFWYGLGYFKRNKNRVKAKEENMEERPELKDRVKEVLVETRIALPGVQATLGFQFIIVLATGFDSLPQSLKLVHMASLLCSAVCAILLIAPAAYHRIALCGEDSEQFIRFASRWLCIALVPLALALTGDATVVVWKVTHSMELALSVAVASLLATLGFWFGYMYWRRGRMVAESSSLRRIESKPPSITSSAVENEKRRCPSPCSPNTMPGTVATCATSSNFAAALRLSASIDVTSGKA